tara:strand:+ start:5866 stop:6768 length:903 start_codon:yes stop_codon:yes gene_type:complete
MSNYIKIPMEDGTTLTTSALALSTITGGGTITGYTARIGMNVYTSTGEGAGATVNVTMDGRALSSVPLTGWGGSVGTASGTNPTAATGTGGSGSGATDPTFTVENNATDAEVTLVTPGDNLKVGDTITIPADIVSGDSQWSSPLTYVVTSSDLVAAVLADLIFTVVNGGTGYANGDLLFMDIADPSGTEVSWDTMISITVSNLSGYLDGPYVLLPASDILCTNPNPMLLDDAVVLYADAQVGGAAPKTATITFNGITTAEERLEITQSLNVAVLQANQAENSQPTLELPIGVRAVNVIFS